MSCKYSSAILLLFSLCLFLFLFSGSVASTGIYARVNNVVYTNNAWLSNQPIDIRSRSGARAVKPTEQDQQNPQQDPQLTAQQSWNSQRSAQRPETSAGTVNLVPKTQLQQPNSAPALATAPAVTVLGVDRPNQASVQPSSSSSPTRPPAHYNYRERFSSKLFQPIARNNARKNVVFSPASMHSMLGLLYSVSSGQTSDELQRAGNFDIGKIEVAMDFKNVDQQHKKLVNTRLIVANKLYYNRELSAPNDRYEAFALEYYNSEIEAVDMKKPRNTAAEINQWVSRATNKIIRELVSPSDIDEQTEAMMVDAIYFKARWANEFSAMDTTPAKFRLNGVTPITVPMMYNDDIFAYAQLPELDATALELPYVDNDASMLLILPNQPNGLAQLERNLASTNHDLNAIAARLRREMVTVRVPKFRIEFEQDMSGPLQELGVRRMFTKQSEVDAMLMQPVRVSKVLQKAFIDVNEAGSEAAAASYAKFVPLSLPVQSLEFTADHPFLFAIRTPETVLFIGHVVQPLQATRSQ
ncbi:antichymotrypsin-2 [Drosophila grimshawi]|uniref:GH20376 n=1 Tax=Drosophila grimshawi TaxID=7222 RepID=B4J400_DROGR|nr:antichymotrypsin-2 [Drosophila grimshawi]EDW01583.1 GH20376 [Drosophila grimshawi]